MVELHIISVDKNDIDKFNKLVHQFFTGNRLYIKNYIVVTPVEREIREVEVEGEEIEAHYFAFDICFFEGNKDPNEDVEKRIVLTTGELNVMKLKKVWAFSEVKDYVSRKAE